VLHGQLGMRRATQRTYPKGRPPVTTLSWSANVVVETFSAGVVAVTGYVNYRGEVAAESILDALTERLDDDGVKTVISVYEALVAAGRITETED
jgi:hypothetical protein